MLLLRGSGITWLLRDEFSDTLAAGSVNGTNATPGPGTRTVTDTNSKLSIGNGVASFATGGVGSGDPGLWYGSMTRVTGRVLVAKTTPNAGTNVGTNIGWDATASGGISDCVLFSTSGALAVRVAVAATALGLFTDGTPYSAAVVQRTAGHWYLIKGGAFLNWSLLWVSATSATTFPAVGAGGAASISTCDFLRIPADLFIPTPLAYDTFTRGNGALGSTETVGPDAQAAPALAWTDQVGTWAIATNAAKASALAGGIAIATVPAGSADALVSANLTRSASNVGIIARYADANNYLYAYHDGTNAVCVQVVAGAPTTLRTAVAAYAAGAPLLLIVSGTEGRLFYNNAAVGAVFTVPASTVNAHGLYTSDTGNSLDAFTVWARGTGGEYAVLDRYVQP